MRGYRRRNDAKTVMSSKPTPALVATHYLAYTLQVQGRTIGTKVLV